VSDSVFVNECLVLLIMKRSKLHFFLQIKLCIFICLGYEVSPQTQDTCKWMLLFLGT
jgi:hypothetical protein